RPAIRARLLPRRRAAGDPALDHCARARSWHGGRRRRRRDGFRRGRAVPARLPLRAGLHLWRANDGGTSAAAGCADAADGTAHGDKGELATLIPSFVITGLQRPASTLCASG